MARFAEGSRVVAYCDPTDPSKAYLLREAQFFPYGTSMYLAIILSGGASWLCWKLMRREGSGDEGETLLERAGGWPQRVFFLSFLAMMAGAMGHYFWISPGPYDVWGCVYMGGVAFVMMVVWVWSVRLRRRIRHATGGD